MADTFVERTSMYACDYEHLTVLGNKPLFDPAPSVAELERVARLVDDCALQLSQPDSQAQMTTAADLQFVTDMWVYRFEECCTEMQGDAVSDALFVARCFMLCSQNPHCRDMSTLNDINELYTRLQLLRTNHTRARFEQQDVHSDVVMLEKRCASLVVYHLCDGPDLVLEHFGAGPLPRIDDLLLAQVLPLRKVPDIIQPSDEDLAREAEKAASEKLAMKSNEHKHDEIDESAVAAVGSEVEYDVNEGSYWHSDKHTVVYGFVRLASRVLRNYWLQKLTFDKFPVRDQPIVYPDSARVCFIEWLQETCQCEYSDDSVKKYRNLVFEHWMPLGSRHEMLRTFSTKHDFMQALNLLENQLGVDSATSLANMARVKTKIVAADPANEVYDFLFISQFSYLMRHITDTDFLDKYYIWPGDLCKLRKRLDCKITWGQPRRPILLRILRGWWIHDAGEWVACSSAMDALLKVMTLWVEKYNSKFVDGISVASWVAQLTSPRNED